LTGGAPLPFPLPLLGRGRGKGRGRVKVSLSRVGTRGFFREERLRSRDEILCSDWSRPS